MRRDVALPTSFDAQIDTAAVVLAGRAFANAHRQRAERLWLSVPDQDGPRTAQAAPRASFSSAQDLEADPQQALGCPGQDARFRHQSRTCASWAFTRGRSRLGRDGLDAATSSSARARASARALAAPRRLASRATSVVGLQVELQLGFGATRSHMDPLNQQACEDQQVGMLSSRSR